MKPASCMVTTEIITEYINHAYHYMVPDSMLYMHMQFQASHHFLHHSYTYYCIKLS